MHLGPGADPGSPVPVLAVEHVDRTLEWHAAIPAIRRRLQERHPALGADVIERCLAAAIDDTSSARIQTYRAILVERRADRSLGELRDGAGAVRPARAGLLRSAELAVGSHLVEQDSAA